MKTTKTMERMMTVALLPALLALGNVVAASSPASAQERIGCLRGQPLPTCKTFWIVEMQGLVPVAQTSRAVTYSGEFAHTYEARSFDNAVEWNLGHMVNVGEGYAVGGVFTVGSGNTDPLTGIRVRGRKWMGTQVSVEAAAGLLRTDGSGPRWESTNGWTADLRLNIRDQGSFFVRYDGVSVEPWSLPGEHGPFDPGGGQHGLSLGASAGSVPALAATGALALVYAVLIAMLWDEN